MIEVKRSDITIRADSKKVIMMFMKFSNNNRYHLVLERFYSLSKKDITTELAYVIEKYSSRHYNFSQRLTQHFNELEIRLGKKIDIDIDSKILLGSYVTQEYSIEGAALFNPSIVPHYEQLEPSKTKFIMSFRPVGEGHVSSISFGTGTICDNNSLQISNQTYSTPGMAVPTSSHSNEEYDVVFDNDIPIEDQVIWPYASSEKKGIEDVRFVQLKDGPVKYIGTYTAYDGNKIKSKLIGTNDFKKFQIRELKGEAIHDKGIAFFPRKIKGKYYAISRQGSENISIMNSESLYEWKEYSPLQSPLYAWDLLQIGNCGSPIETDKGWLVLTHGVGVMREYALGVMLLDLEDPSIVIATLKDPLMKPLENEREGYVPNVLYTCGWMEHKDTIIIPYAMSDSACSFATVKTEELLKELVNGSMI
ncbi:MAG: glycoside hydrolase family 130 protein [Cyclobacteriaceae bacterium]|nr:glycoside hydrolase family 130 protein [Cyclobacteriaceae bacterium]